MVSIVHAVRDIGRVRDVSRVLVRHGFGEIVVRLGLGRSRRGKGPSSQSEETDELSPEDLARGEEEQRRTSSSIRIRHVLEDLGPSFIKLGQIASTRTDVLPPDLIVELKKLQDAVPEVPFEAIAAQVEASLGASISEVFESFDPKPLAAASIAQVHRATLRTEEGVQQVVVKVQRPGIAQTIASDVDILHGLAALVERLIPESRIYSPVGLVQQFDHAISAELDFTTEAENAGRFRQNFEGFQGIAFPKVYKQASSKHVLTLEFLSGIKLDAAVAAGHSGKALAGVSLDIIIKQIFDDGFFHADPHPGNILVMGTPEAPIIGMIDLGMVGRLSPRMRDLTVDVMVAAVRKDYEGIADALYQIGTPTKKVDMEAYRAEVSLLAEKYLGKQLKDIDLSGLIRDIVYGATKYGLEVPSDFMLVGKALMTVEGVGKELDPELDVFEDAKHHFFQILKKRYSPERLGNELLRRVERLTSTSYNMPQQIGEVLEDLRLGRLELKLDDRAIAPAADRLGRRLYSALLASSLLLGGAWLVAADSPIVGGVLLGLGVLLVGLHVLLDVVRALRASAKK